MFFQHPDNHELRNVNVDNMLQDVNKPHVSGSKDLTSQMIQVFRLISKKRLEEKFGPSLQPFAFFFIQIYV